MDLRCSFMFCWHICSLNLALPQSALEVWGPPAPPAQVGPTQQRQKTKSADTDNTSGPQKGNRLFHRVKMSPPGLGDVSGEQWLFGGFSASYSSYRKWFMSREEVRAATIISTVSCRGEEEERGLQPPLIQHHLMALRIPSKSIHVKKVPPFSTRTGYEQLCVCVCVSFRTRHDNFWFLLLATSEHWN